MFRIAGILGFSALLVSLASAQNPPVPAPPIDRSAIDLAFRSALVSLQQKQFPEAEAAFRKILELDPDGLVGPFGIAQVYMAQGREDDAIRVFMDARAKKPAVPEIMVALGDLNVRAHRYDQALELFRTALPLIDFRNATTFYVHHGAIGADPVTDSLSALAGADAIPRGAAGIQLRIAEVYTLRKDLPAAIEVLRKVRESLPRDPVALGALGVTLEAAGKKEDAVAIYREAIDVDPKNAMILNNLAYLMTETGGDLFDALRLARRAQALRPGILEITDTIGWISLKQGWIDDAFGTFSELVRKQPGNKTYREHLLAALDLKPDKSVAAESLKAALKGDPSDDNMRKIEVLLPSPKK